MSKSSSLARLIREGEALAAKAWAPGKISQDLAARLAIKLEAIGEAWKEKSKK